MVLIFIRILLTWIPRIPYNPVLNAVIKFVTDVTDPYLNLFRRFLPPVRLGPGRPRPQPDRGHLRAHHRGAIIVGLMPAERGAPGSCARCVTAGVVVALDQVTKALVKDRDRSRASTWTSFPGLELSNVRNTGVAFGALEGAGLAVAVLIGLSLDAPDRLLRGQPRRAAAVAARWACWWAAPPGT